MKTLDRYIVRSFLFSAVLWFAVLMALRIIADLFVNMDEFTERGLSFVNMLWGIIDYYRYQAVLYFIELGGVIIVASAAFTLARMNQTNELTAILASGVNLHRVVWPIILCSLVMAALVIVDQELIIPNAGVRSHLTRDRDELPGAQVFSIDLIADGSGSVWHAREFKPAEEHMENPVVIVRDKQFRPLSRIYGTSAQPMTLDGKAGWVFEEVALGRITREAVPWPQTPTYQKIWTSLEPQRILDKAKKVAADAGAEVPPDDEIDSVEYVPPVSDAVYNMVLRVDRIDLDQAKPGVARGGWITRPRFSFAGEDDIPLGTLVADSAVWRLAEGAGHWVLTNGRFFYPSDLTTEYLLLRQSSRWLSYMSTAELTRLLRLKRVRSEAALLRDTLASPDPINNLIMLLLGLPFILSRERTIRASASGCLLVVGFFYMCVYACRYLDMPPQWAAWLPILVFGPAAVVMYDSVKT